MAVVQRIFDDPHPIEVNNSSRRLPVVICLDVSGSMRDSIDDLKEGLRQFFEQCRADENAKYSCDVMILTFSENITVIQHFDTVSNITKNGIPSYPLEARGFTATGEAVRMALQLLDERYQKIGRNAISRYKPWLVVMSDGFPEGRTKEETAERMRVLDEVSQDLKKRSITTFSVGIGKYNNAEVMNKLSVGRTSVHLQADENGHFKFNEFFTWLSSGVSSTSAQASDQPVIAQPISSWAQGWDTIETAPSSNGNWNESF